MNSSLEAPYKAINALNYESEHLLRAMRAHDIHCFRPNNSKVALREDGEAQGGEVPWSPDMLDASLVFKYFLFFSLKRVCSYCLSLLM